MNHCCFWGLYRGHLPPYSFLITIDRCGSYRRVINGNDKQLAINQYVLKLSSRPLTDRHYIVS